MESILPSITVIHSHGAGHGKVEGSKDMQQRNVWEK